MQVKSILKPTSYIITSIPTRQQRQQQQPPFIPKTSPNLQSWKAGILQRAPKAKANLNLTLYSIEKCDESSVEQDSLRLFEKKDGAGSNLTLFPGDTLNSTPTDMTAGHPTPSGTQESSTHMQGDIFNSTFENDLSGPRQPALSVTEEKSFTELSTHVKNDAKQKRFNVFRINRHREGSP